LQKLVNNLIRRIFFSLKFLKQTNFIKNKRILILKRSMNISRTYLTNNVYFIDRGLYPVLYLNNFYSRHYKFGMFSFPRKPFAIPLKKKFNIKKR
jgi:hypothetical protein